MSERPAHGRSSFTSASQSDGDPSSLSNTGGIGGGTFGLTETDVPAFLGDECVPIQPSAGFADFAAVRTHHLGGRFSGFAASAREGFLGLATTGHIDLSG